LIGLGVEQDLQRNALSSFLAPSPISAPVTSARLDEISIAVECSRRTRLLIGRYRCIAGDAHVIETITPDRLFMSSMVPKLDPREQHL
jgi:hypothetical protein